MSAPNPHVSVFHFTSRISSAKIRKYKLATERGMAPGNVATPSVPTANNDNEQPSNATRTSTSTSTSTRRSGPEFPGLAAEPPEAKKPRLTLSVRAPTRKDSPGDNVNASRRDNSDTKFRYSSKMVIAEDEPQIKSADRISSAPASTSSSLSSAPSERDECSFKDPTPPRSARDDYGDFMAYYIAPGGESESEDPEVLAKTKSKVSKTSKAQFAKSKPDPGRKPKPKSKAEPNQPRRCKQTAAPSLTATGKLPPRAQVEVSNASPRDQRPTASQKSSKQDLPPQLHAQNGQQLHHSLAPHPNGALAANQLPLPQSLPLPPPHLPHRIIQFIDIPHDPKPVERVTTADMITKLEKLSNTLTECGGVPAVPETPPAVPPALAREAKPIANKAGKRSSAKKDLADSLLSHFDIEDEGDDDDSDDEADMTEQEHGPARHYLANPGAPDEALIYGIVFIQNALKSWGRQRLYDAAKLRNPHQQVISEQQMDESNPPPVHPGGPPQVIRMDLADTPEGQAIQDFQSILDSGCLQISAILPAEVARAVRHLYMHIEHLINQGPSKTAENNWECMSYHSQIAAHKLCVDRYKEQQIRAHQEALRQQDIANRQMMAQMEERSHTAELSLERRRSVKHAEQQPYISQLHLNPLELGSRLPSIPNGRASLQPPASANAAYRTAPVYGETEHRRQKKIHRGPDSPCSSNKLPDRESSVRSSFTNSRKDPSNASKSNVPSTTIDLTSDGPEMAPLKHTQRTTTGGFAALNKPASASASPALSSTTASVLREKTSGKIAANFPHPGAVVIDQ